MDTAQHRGRPALPARAAPETPGPATDTAPGGLVWHYTDGAGLVSILTNHVLWATSASFLNDEAEVMHGLRLLEDRLRERAAAGEATAQQMLAAVDAADARHGPSAGMFYVLSASRSPDSLAMWRCYGRARESYAVGLDPTAGLRVLADGPPEDEPALVRRLAWTPVAYGRDDQLRLVDDVLDGAARRAERLRGLAAERLHELTAGHDAAGHDAAGWERDAAGGERDAAGGDPARSLGAGEMEDMLEDLEQAMLLVKHPGFVEEQETRYAAVVYQRPGGTWGRSAVRYRDSAYGIAPYLRLTGPGDDPQQPTTTTPQPLPVRAVSISPSPNGESARESVRALLRSAGYDVPVVRSAIPFRG